MGWSLRPMADLLNVKAFSVFTKASEPCKSKGVCSEGRERIPTLYPRHPKEDPHSGDRLNQKMISSFFFLPQTYPWHGRLPYITIQVCNPGIPVSCWISLLGIYIVFLDQSLCAEVCRGFEAILWIS